jgi:hypothetical protein
VSSSFGITGRASLLCVALIGLGARAEAQPPHVPCADTGPVELEGTGPKATIELEGPPPDLTLLRHLPPFGWRSVCQAPCVVIAPAGVEYKLRGSGITESETFFVDPALGDRVRVRVEPVSQGALIAGTILIYAGVSIMPSGVLGIVTGYVTDQRPLVTIGFITLGVGAALAGVGLPLFIANTKSDVAVERGAATGVARPLPPRPRQPEQPKALPEPVPERSGRTLELPLLSGSF